MPARPDESSTTADEITVSKAATLYDVSKRTLQALAVSGRIPARLVGKTYLLDHQAVRLYAQARQATRDLNDYAQAAS
ncbi:helix-turn-helix domain-containing protein [Mycobacteroides abscessus]|uniref:helix-turn-helix domain-containing protein n=1 Tax=Mycobacteroides abscessus TaxID=36809 RepID=UPI000925CDDC|nr:helix-turn-helix domain-containing protein [Mycobacteroides abscessus]SIG30151.1 DNA binding domain, excisionase family [Mycobacteroides abscessus subsp. abscessus]SIH55176.1 DNA binding domain, excisionase family [Mycobacteroides abscessus subsp. abscessus]SIM80155.1 DNA binding domain, excisionase family [Mycobacteroides abscessus subsp. abscessus]